MAWRRRGKRSTQTVYDLRTMNDTERAEVRKELTGKVNKKGARKVVENGIVFDSGAERDRYLELRLLEQTGQITDLKTHADDIQYVLLDKFRDKHGKMVREIKYTPDFCYMESGALVLEDVKGAKEIISRDFPLRVKLFKRRYPEIDLYIVYMLWDKRGRFWCLKERKLA